ncbi:TetR/AcrR family transcriptional regulator [Rhodococcus triatomae]|uniref:DNA-binding transcriptional regulator, AcrR family n=1 Tax=Rhodococcus triatomae TaxID=300028 RepID=A0A1G8R7I4_9NOCA|nr:TetR/AcrR family transcriptional regulator [Rhodococcus triatomae]QNG19598.1 TetR/AcrR family transcriptional regulator [Rhodococcus triatomae]QNG24487.1 TetR/AcrR family transcriptional regulator [Rhodococcus triatomae]SDJ12908.1 DNA-binding transcriptional regulator, AcrR family [Rhodococcus triatomae]
MTRVVGKRAARRAELFDQLVGLFLDEGFAHLTLDDVAARLRCSKSTLYTLAESKDDLVRAATVHFFRRAADEVEEALARVDSGAGDRVTAYLEAVGDQLAPASARFMEDLARMPGARGVYEQNTAIAAERVRTLIAEGVGAGEFRSVSAEFVADVVASTMVRIQQRDVARATGFDDAQAYRELAALVTRGIAR